MRVVCTILLVLFGVASPMSLWAAVVSPCSQQDQTLSRSIVIVESLHDDMAAHNGHGATHEASSHHGDHNDGDSSPRECDCCATCVSACASSATTSIAIGSEPLNSLLDNQSPPGSGANWFYSNPDRNSLFRPPKPDA